MKVGAVIPFWLDRPSIEAVEIAQTADAAGLDELWVGEMVTFDAFALAGAIAGRTEAITIVCGPLPAAVRSPAALALGVASVSVLGSRTAHLAVGASTPTVVRDWHCREWDRMPARTAETIETVRRLLSGERVGTFRLRDPVPDAQVRAAAFGPRMLDVASEHADGIVLNLLTPRAVGEIKAKIASAAVSAGRRSPPVAAWVPAAYEPGPATFEQLRRQLAVYVPQPGYGEMFARAGFADVVDEARRDPHPKAVAGLISDDFIAATCALGSESELADRFADYADAGVDTLCVVPATAEDPNGEKVLRSAAGFGRANG